MRWHNGRSGAPETCNTEKPTKAALLSRTRAQRIPFRPGDSYSNKGRIHSRRPTRHSHFSLAIRRRTIHSVLSLAYIGTASATESGVNLRVDPRRFRLGGKKEAAGMFAADAVSLWRLNQSAPGINYLARSTTVEKAHSPSPYSPSMAQASVRGACGFVLADKHGAIRLEPSGARPWNRR